MAQIDLQIAKLKKDDKAISTAQGRVGEFQQALKDAQASKGEGEPEKNTKEDLLKRYKKQLDSAKEAGDEEKIKKIQAAIDKISAKESWQLEGTELGRIYEMELRKLENQLKLNESRYTGNSIADNFRKLLS
jgi:uncharacterized membrane protein (DUF106 family)